MKLRWWKLCVRAPDFALVALLWSAVVASAFAAARVEHLDSGAVLPADLPFSEAVRVDDVVYLSGQIGVKPGTLELVPGGMAAEARQTLDNIRTTLQAHGLSLDDVVKCTVMLADIGEWGVFNEIYQSYFRAPYPARSALGASGLAFGARVEVECLAVVRAPVDAPTAAPPTPPAPREADRDDTDKRVYKRPNAQ
ncbi:MAG: Rid family detoxifying hydrolase [Pseudomonadales bacterium]